MTCFGPAADLVWKIGAMMNAACRLSGVLSLALAMGIVCPEAFAQVTLLGVQYRADQAFPEHDCFWDAAQYPSSCPLTSPMGGSAHVFLRNDGSTAVTVNDVVFAGLSLDQVLALHYQVEKRQPASIWLAGLSPEDLQTMLNAGEPVWYKADPITIAPGGTTQVVVRLRQAPQVASLSVDIVHSTGTTSAVVPVEPDQPRPVGVYFSSDLTRACVYWRHPQGGAAPVTIRFDGIDVTASTTTASDPGVSLAVSVLQFAQALSPGSFHVFQGVYSDGKTATAGARAWNNPFLYGMWGAWPGAEGNSTVARNYILDVTNHNINAQMVTLGSQAVQSYLKTAEGMQFAIDHGLGFVVDEIGQWSVQHPYLWFIRDEPDAADSRVTDIPEDKKIGSLAQMGVQRADYLRGGDPAVPTILNLDMTYKPFNWYNYGQLPDVVASDPYYQARLRDALWNTPARIPLYSKATYIYAVSQLAQSAAEPNPLHVVLYACEYVDTAMGRAFPFPTPQSKRIEVYYALAAGAKGLSYWWYIPSTPANGVGDATVHGDPVAAALWKEMGLLGAEARTAAPILVTSCPATLAIQASEGLWARALLAGPDTLVLIAVNDQYYNDEQGCHYTPLGNAGLTVDLPAWLGTPTVFDIAAGGIRDVTSQLTGDQLQISLGPVDLTRMIVVTSDGSLRSTIEQRYAQEFRSKVCNLAPELCTPGGPTITQQPVSQNAYAGSTVYFTVAASGSGTLSYQWQKNSSNLSDGGHYAGCTTATLTISNVDSSDAANYRCIVTDSNGSTSSSQAQLTVEPAPIPGDFDHDGDVDQDDFGHFQACYSGRSVPQTSPDCADALLDPDGDVDSDDFAIFQNCLSGPGTPAGPDCAG